MSKAEIPPWGLTLDEFADVVRRELKAAGFAGEIRRDAVGRLVCGERQAFDLLAGREALCGLPPERRDEFLSLLVKTILHPAKAPDTWEEARARVVPRVQPMILQAVRAGHAQAGARTKFVPYGAVTDHVTVEVGLPLEQGYGEVDTDLLAAWGVSFEAAMQQASENVMGQLKVTWQAPKEMPGVFRGPCNDGNDPGRILQPAGFRQCAAFVPVRGDPVVLLPSSRSLLVAGADDEEGLFSLARLAKRILEHEGMHVSRPLCLRGSAWEPWSPPRSHPAWPGLRLLEAAAEKAEYAAQAQCVERIVAEPERLVRLPPIEIAVGRVGAEPLTVTTWYDGGPCALPRADVVVLRRAGEVLGAATWEDVLRTMGSALVPQPTYPPRWLADAFPEEWQLGGLNLQPFQIGPEEP